MSKRDLVIIGNGMATSRLLDDLIQRNAQRWYNLTVLGEERGGCYNRIMLGKVLGGGDADHVVMKPPEWYAANGVRFHPGTRAERLDTGHQVVHCAEGKAFPYDIAVIATGSSPFVPPIEGMARASDGKWKEGLFAYRTLDDCTEMRSRVKPGQNAVVLGGGLLGLEAAKGLSDMGMHVTVIHLVDTLMNQQLDRTGGDMLRRQIERCGIFVRTGRTITKVLGEQSVDGVQLDDGRKLPADLLVLACGIRPRVELAKASDIPINRGILVNDTLATQVPGVYAIGECAEHVGTVYGIVTPIWEQATSLADVLSGANPTARYRGSKMYAKLKVAGVAVASMGVTESELPSDEVVQIVEERKLAYRKMIVRDGKLIGAMFVGDAEGFASLVQVFDRGERMPPNRLDALCSLTAGGGMAADRQVCNCHRVNESEIVEAIGGGACTVEQVSECTKAGTGCGSCRGQLAQLVVKHASKELAVSA